MSYGIIDIHCHLLWGVDDGARTKEDSINMLDRAVEQGIKSIVLTPHYRHGMFKFPVDVIKKNFKELQSEADRRGVNLYLGCEYHVNSSIVEYLQTGRCLTMADSDYVLSEYSYETTFREIKESVEELFSYAYIPVIAHVERYECFVKKPKLVEELRNKGAMIQVDANAVLGLEGREGKKCTKALLKNELVDIIASDSHDIYDRRNNMLACYEYVTKKYGEDMAYRTMVKNPRKIILQ